MINDARFQLVVVMFMPSILLAFTMFQQRNHFMPSEQRLLRAIRSCTIAVCLTVVVAALFINQSLS